MKDSRVPPYSPDSEKGILGCCLDDGSLVGDLQSEWFYDIGNKLIAEVLIGMCAKSEVINSVNLCNKLGEEDLKKIKGREYIFELSGFGPSPSNYPTHRSVLIEKLQLRRIIQASYEAVEKAFTADASRNPTAASDAVTEFEAVALGLRTEGDDVECEDIKVLIDDVVGEMEYDMNNQGTYNGVVTGFKDIDDLTNGLRPGQIFIIAARPSVGKSSLAMNIAENISVSGNSPVGFFTFEMTPNELVYRMACSINSMDSNLTHKGIFTEGELARLATTKKTIRNSNLKISNCVGKNIYQLAGRAKRLTAKYGLKLGIVDHLALVDGGVPGMSKYQEVTMVSHRIKKIAKECGIPFILLAQLNRSLEKEDRKPVLSDLRDSGSVEEDGDIIGLLSVEDRAGDNLTVLLDVQKNRTGIKRGVWLNFQETYTKFRPGTKPSQYEP